MHLGRVEKAIGNLDRHGSAVTGTNADAVRQAMADDWWRHRQSGDDALMMAHRNVDVDDLNRRARSHLADAHQLQGETLVVNERPFQIGDTVVCLRNDHQRKIRNGTVGEIVSIDHENRSVLLDTADGLRRLHQEYLDEGWMRHGYAVTVHKAQGLTCEHGLLLATDEMHHEMGYVGLSRGRLSNRLYAVTTETVDADLDRHEPKGAGPQAGPLGLVIESMSTSAAKDLAINQRQERQADLDAGFEIDL
jgi:ATP-dependent exoDNAse (exonuclease V) alpha subunit